MTVSQEYYKSFIPKMTISGLTYKFSNDSEDLIQVNKDDVEHNFLLDYLKIQLLPDSNQKNVNKQNINYLNCFKLVYNYYLSTGDKRGANNIKELASLIAKDSGDPIILSSIEKDFDK